MNNPGVHFENAEEAAAHLAAIVESSFDAIISKNLNGIITSWNKSAASIFGFTPDEAIGQHISLIIPAERLEEEREIIAKIQAGQTIEHFETIRCRKDGTLVTLSLSISPVRNASGKIIGASKIARDISERKKTEEALQELSERKEDFVANMSHELRTPLNAVVGLTNILMQTSPLTQKQTHYLDALKVSSDNLLSLINDILDFSKLEQDAILLEEIHFDFFQTIEKIKLLSNFKAREKRIDLIVDYDPNLPHAFIGDPLRLHQIINNLVSNALKFTDEGFVKLEVTSASGEDLIQGVVIKVTDTGIGIDPSKQETVFDKFTQADNSIARRYGGSGLGLAICRTLIHKMGGTIQLESTPGMGSCFTATIPLRKAPQIVAGDAGISNPTPASGMNHKNVLVVEDHESNALVTSVLLEEYGLTYDIAPNGLDALRRFRKTAYDVILMDIQMPELDGIDATKTIRKIEREEMLHHTPIIAMTAHVMEKDKSKCLSAGMDDFLSKPFERDLLLKKIDHFLRLRPSQTAQRVEA